MEVTMVFPGIAIEGFNCFGKRDYISNYINHGLCSISAYAKKEGHKVSLIDLRKLKGWDEYRTIISGTSPKVIAVSMMSIDLLPSIEALKIAKQVIPDVITIVGGVHPTIMLEETKKISEIDVIVTGEGEITFSQILGLIQEGKTPERVYHGIPPDLDKLPPIDRDLFDISAELRTPFTGTLPPPFVTINIGRGCPYKCSFCQPAERMIFGNKVRIRSVDNVIDELKYLHERFRFNSFMVHDDLFTFNNKWIARFCDEYEKTGIGKKYICQSRADIICNNEEMIRRMKETGLEMLLIGFESGSQRVLDFIKKGVTVEQNLKAAEICKKYGIKIFANYMFGIPTETREEVDATVKMMDSIDPEFHSPSFFTPHPGSELYEYCKANNLSLIKDFEVDRTPSSPKIKGVDYDYLLSKISYIKRKEFPRKLLRKIKRLFRVYS